MLVINNKGEISRFNVDKIVDSIVKETGLDVEIARSIADSIWRSFSNTEAMTTSLIREKVCEELSNRGYIKERMIYINSLNPDKMRFHIDPAFYSRYKDRQPKWGPIGYVTYKRTYARYIENEGRTEEFHETVKRVVEGVFTIQKKYCFSIGLPWDEEEAQQKAKRMFEKIWNFKFLPPGRGLWMMGTEFVEKHGSMALNNCAFVSTENIENTLSTPFEFLMDALMLGVGVGFDTKGAGKITIKRPSSTINFTIPDSRGGWVLSLRLLLRAFFLGEPMPRFDYSKIRPKGERIKGFGGVASGPGPLKEMHNDIRVLLSKRINEKISSTDIVDIMNLIGKCVVAGNVRRSAEIALGEHDDDGYISLKDPELYSKELMHHRWASNNSVIAEKGMDYSKIVDSLVKNGEPGILWLENSRAYGRMIDPPDWRDKNVKGVNPCGEQSLESFELCCLVETFPSNHESYEEFEETLEYAYLYAKTVTLVNTHWDAANAVMLKNRRMGISQTGIIDAFAKYGKHTILEWADRGYRFLRNLDEKFSDRFCIPKSIKITTVKPSGTVSLLAGVSPGIHYPYAEYYIRRVRIAKNSELVPILQKAGYPCEESVTDSSTLVFEFPIRTEHFTKCQRDVSIWEQVANAVDFQRYWSDNQVSITISFKHDEADQIKSVLEFVEDKLKSISFLPFEEHGYVQAPYEEITKEEYEKRVSSLKPINMSGYSEAGEGVEGCDGDHCTI